MNKKFSIYTYTAAVLFIVMALPAYAQTPSPEPSQTVTPSPASDSTVLIPPSSESVPVVAPPTGSSGSSIAPPTGNSGSSIAPPTGSSGSSIAPSVPSVPSTGSSGSSIGQSSGSSPAVDVSSPNVTTSSGGRRFGIFAVTPVASTTISIGSCPPFITAFMKLGNASNNRADVAKLQIFLKDREGANVDVTGIFDQKTESAVRSFQKKYLKDIMGPWGATRSSGIVHITTQKKINQLICATPLSLNASELAIIDRYKQAIRSGTPESQIPIVGISPTDDSVTITFTPGDVTATGSIPILSDADRSEGTAAAGNVSVVRRLWEFLKSLFR